VTGAWAVEQPDGSVADRHGPVGEIVRRVVVRHRVPRPTVVLGSGQRESSGLEGRAAAAGLDVVRRRSGGGAVLLLTEGLLWVDVLVPRIDPLWDDDVGRSSAWLGAAWCTALESVGVDAVMHRGPMACGVAGRAVCFVGRAAGEVLCEGRKVVGVSQRRDRSGARFQCAVLLGTDAGARSVAPLVDLLGVEPRVEALAEVDVSVGGLSVEADRLFEVFLGALP
jgi:lipoate-protein ligase A